MCYWLGVSRRAALVCLQVICTKDIEHAHTHTHAQKETDSETEDNEMLPQVNLVGEYAQQVKEDLPYNPYIMHV